MSQSDTSRAEWEAAVCELLCEAVPTVVEVRTRRLQSLPSLTLESLWSPHFPGSRELTIEIFRQTPGCREALLEAWNFSFTAGDSAMASSRRFKLDLKVVSRALAVLTRALPFYSNPGDTLMYSVVLTRELHRQWSSAVRPSDISAYPRRPILVQSPYGQLAVSASIVCVVQADELVPIPLGGRSRLISIDSADECVRLKTSAISSLAQKCAGDYHNGGFLPLSHSMPLFEEQSTFSSEREASFDLDFYDDGGGGECSESAAIAVFLDSCERERENALFAAKPTQSKSQDTIIQGIFKEVRQRGLKKPCMSVS